MDAAIPDPKPHFLDGVPVLALLFLTALLPVIEVVAMARLVVRLAPSRTQRA